MAHFVHVTFPQASLSKGVLVDTIFLKHLYKFNEPVSRKKIIIVTLVSTESSDLKYP